ncbi:acyltransferase [uncultured Clostridium sp.]|uniref:acyltransferase family protein n=1 Tax=uncultured Clostridium sp. TaxID=59620 RepID=UPI002598DBEF|nr:acyltransferase [uncultured Clostridium sp.]
MNNEKIILRELDYLKIIGILLVVIGHCTSIYTGGWVFTSPVNSPIYGLIASYVYTFHVPMLVFVSGAIYYYCRVNKGKYGSLKSLIINKFKRLILPFLFIGILYSIPIKYIIEMTDGNIVSNIKSFVLGLNTGHLWYLLMLFNTFILFYLYESFILNKKYSIVLNLILFSILYISSGFFTNIFQINRSIQYSIFFYLGYEFFRSKDKLILKLEKLKSKSILIMTPILIAISLVLILVSKMKLSSVMLSKFFSLINVVIAMICITICYLIVYLINNRMKNIIIKDKIDKLINIIGKHSFNIYMLHEPIIFIILYFIANRYINPNILVMVCLSISILGSILISIIYNKIKELCNNKQINFQQ